MAEPFGVAIVGCGMIAGFHARALAEIPDAKLVALARRVQASAHRIQEEATLLAAS